MKAVRADSVCWKCCCFGSLVIYYLTFVPQGSLGEVVNRLVGVTDSNLLSARQYLMVIRGGFHLKALSAQNFSGS
jgi:hypothetical protein